MKREESDANRRVSRALLSSALCAGLSQASSPTLESGLSTARQPPAVEALTGRAEFLPVCLVMFL